MFSEILPPSVKCSILMGYCNDSCLLEEERPLVRNAVPKRIRDFAGGRFCAREALSQLGIAPRPILVGPKRQPVWPAQIVGSITHCDGCSAAAVARQKDVASLGIDVEPNLSLPEGVLEMVANSGEIESIASLPTGRPWDRLLFSAKESIYKAWYPLVGLSLGFHDVSLTIDPVSHSFSIEFLKGGEPESIFDRFKWIGRYQLDDRFLYTTVMVN